MKRTETDDQRLVLFGETLKRLRKQTGLSQEATAHKIGVHRTYYSAIERGEKNITLIVLLRIAQSLDVPPSDLVADLVS